MTTDAPQPFTREEIDALYKRADALTEHYVAAEDNHYAGAYASLTAALQMLDVVVQGSADQASYEADAKTRAGAFIRFAEDQCHHLKTDEAKGVVAGVVAALLTFLPTLAEAAAAAATPSGESPEAPAWVKEALEKVTTSP